MSRRDALEDWITRGTKSVREDARRALHELVSRGDLSAEEAQALESAVTEAIDRSTSFVSENVLTPLRAVAEGLGTLATPAAGAGDEALRERLDALDARLERIERQLAARGDGGREQP